MATELQVGAADASEIADLQSYVVTLAEHPDGSGWHIMFQLPIDPSPQDVALGMGGYAITTSEGATVYGGVATWQQRDSEIEFLLDDAAAEKLGIEPALVFHFQTEDAATRTSAGLKRVLA